MHFFLVLEFILVVCVCFWLCSITAAKELFRPNANSNFFGSLKTNSINVLMLVAHPDDEMLFGAHDVLRSNTTLICLTNANDDVRQREFDSAMKIVNLKSSFILRYADTFRKPWPFTAAYLDLVNIVEKLVKSTKYDFIVSHSHEGEYGHCHHMQLHILAKKLAFLFGISFKTFCDRYDPDDLKDSVFVDFQKRALVAYDSQAFVIKNFNLSTSFPCNALSPYARKRWKKNQHCVVQPSHDDPTHTSKLH